MTNERPRQTMTREQILNELSQIDKEHFGLTESLNRAAAEFQESRQGDDDAIEGEAVEQKLSEIRSELEEIERRRAELRKFLEDIGQAA